MPENSAAFAESPQSAHDSAALMPLGELLVARELIAEADRDRALSVQAQIGGRLGAILIRLGAIGEDGLLPVLSEQLEMPLIGADDCPQDMRAVVAWLSELPIARDWWVDQGVIAWEDLDGRVRACARDPLDQAVSERLERVLATRDVTWCLLASQTLERMLERLTDLLACRWHGS